MTIVNQHHPSLLSSVNELSFKNTNLNLKKTLKEYQMKRLNKMNRFRNNTKEKN